MQRLKELFSKVKREPDKASLRHNERGFEKLDPTPAAIPVNFKKPETIQEQIARLVRYEFSQQGVKDGYESFEESDDFDMDDDDPHSPYEAVFDPTMTQPRTKFVEETPVKPVKKKAVAKGEEPVDPQISKGSSTDDE